MVEPQVTVEIRDRGLAYGDGVFSTVAVKAGVPLLWQLHGQRLARSLARLGIVCPDLLALEQQLLSYADGRTGVLKLVLTRGEGGRGYSTQGVGLPHLLLAFFDQPVHLPNWRQHGVQLQLATLKLGIQPALAGIKTLNRLEQVLGKQEIDQLGCDEAVFCDSDGMLVECNAANLFWRCGADWYTPDLSGSGVDGVMRQHLLVLMAQQGLDLNICRQPATALDGADEIFISNTLIGVVPACAYRGRALHPSETTRQLQAAVAQVVL